MATTCGALQSQAKAALIEPKTYFANERLFLHWLENSITLASLATVLSGYSYQHHPSSGATVRRCDAAPERCIVAIAAAFFGGSHGVHVQAG